MKIALVQQHATTDKTDNVRRGLVAVDGAGPRAAAFGYAHDCVRSARIVMGAVAPVPWRSQPAEAALTGKPITEATAAAAADASVRDARPLSQNAYKIQVAKTAVERAILHAAGLPIA